MKNFRNLTPFLLSSLGLLLASPASAAPLTFKCDGTVSTGAYSFSPAATIRLDQAGTAGAAGHSYAYGETSFASPDGDWTLRLTDGEWDDMTTDSAGVGPYLAAYLIAPSGTAYNVDGPAGGAAAALLSLAPRSVGFVMMQARIGADFGLVFCTRL